MATERDKRVAGEAPTGPVAIFIDWDNFAIGLRQEMPKQPADLGPILRWVRRFGPLMVCRAYGEWRDPAERLAIYNAGVEVVYAPVLPLGGSVMARDGGGAKSLADTAMAVDVTEMLSLIPGLSTLVLATSDKDLIPVLRFAQRRGLYAVIIGSDRTAGALRELADEFISYRQLLELESGGAPTPRPGTVPPLRFPRGFQASITPLPSSATPSAGALPAPSAAAAGRPARTAAPAAVSTGDSTATASSAPATRPGAGSAMATEEEEAGATTVTARRRRRGGRRRGAGDLAVSATAPESAAEPASEEAEPPVEAEAGESPPPTMMAAATSPALPLPPVPAIAEPTPAGESRGVRATPGSIGLVEPAPVAGEAGAPPDAPLVAATAPTEPVRQEPPLPALRPSAPPERRAPVVLPGERLRKLAASAPPAATPASVEPPPAESPPAEPAPLDASTPAMSLPTTPAESPAEQEVEQPGAIAELAGGDAGTEPAPAAASEAGVADGAVRGSPRGRRGGRGRAETPTSAGAPAPAEQAPPVEATQPELQAGTADGAATSGAVEPDVAAPAAGDAGASDAGGENATAGEGSANQNGRRGRRRGSRSR